ncbi:hypothetical protein CVR96_27315, partial [Salmonella enterica subsp. enterica serovar Typhimurium]|uniref:hypothetical protein n=1 Tax=Salmonella enterica TaxID=28901 RepID=UPI000CBA18C1
QHPGAMWVMEATDRSKNQFGVLQQSKYSQELLQNVVATPQVTVQSFWNDLNSVRALVHEIEMFLTASDHSETSKTNSKE